MRSRPDRTLLAIAVFAAAKLLFHTLTNHQYGFHRDELATLDDARNLARGFVAYPPLTPLLGRISLELFGTSLPGFRFFAAAAQSLVVVLAAWTARRMGGGAWAQWLTALAVAIGTVSLAASALMQYVSFDILWWVAVAALVSALAQSDDPRWWVPVGAAIGLGVLTKYTVAFLVAGLVVAVFATPLRSHLRSRWLWAGAAVSLAIAAPNLLWQVQHEFVSLEFLRHIHERDVRIGRTDGFLLQQLYVPANPVSIPLWVVGFGALAFSERLRTFRPLAWMAAVPFLLFVVARGRSYYTAGIYVPLIAAGAVMLTHLAASWPRPLRVAAASLACVLLLAGSGVALIALPLAPVGSPLWNTATKVNGDFAEEVGWPELVGQVATIWRSMPESERRQAGIFASNYGEAGAVNLYGPSLGLPRAISGVNSYWARGYPTPPPRTLIVLGADREDLAETCSSVSVAGLVSNRFGVANEETREHREIHLCRGLKVPWEQIWPRVRAFG